MRTLTSQDLNSISGGETTEIYFELIPGLEIIGFEKTLVGYDVYNWAEPVGLFSNKYYEIQNPVYEYAPIYAETVTTYSFV